MAYSVIKKPSDYFNTVLYTGDGSSSRNITGVGFQPDWVWFKQRSGTQSHTAIDAVRTGDSKLRINASSAEFTGQSYNFNSDGFGWTTQDDESNQNGATYASWNWKANGAGVANTDGSISSTVSVNTTSGFSIVKYTAGSSGANSDTIGHGLGVIPQMIILKTTTAIDSWVVYHHSNGAGKSMVLNNNTAVATNSNIYPTTPTSSVFYPGNTATTNGSSRSYIAYCFAEKQGFSKFGSYTGNGSTDGTFVYTGFKPAFVICKRTTTSGYNWILFDNKREGFNLTNDYLQPNTSDAEIANNASQCVDFLSNGFKHRGSGDSNNASNVPYIYMAFAEEPLVGDNPATAR